MTRLSHHPALSVTDPHPPLSQPAEVASPVVVADRPTAPAGYTLDHLLGSGGQAQVWSGRNTRLDMPVALKLWPSGLDCRDRERIRREIEVLTQLAGHPHIVRLLDGDVSPHVVPWMATELCDQSLAARLRSGPISVVEAFTVAEDILTGTAALHRAGHLHRDLKPANVLLHNGRAKLCDLGLTGRIENRTSMHFSGTPLFVAPELRTEQPTIASDVYSLGRTLEALFEVTFRPHPIPADLDALLTRATSSRPDDRPAGAEAFRQALTALHPRERPARGGRPTASPRRNAPASEGRIRSVLVAGTAAAGVGLGLIALVLVASGFIAAQGLVGHRWTPPPTAHATAPSSPMATQQIQSLYASRCVDVRGPLPDDGTPLQLWDCINVPEERWRWDGERLRGFADKCIGLPDDHGRDGTPVQLTTCADDPRQAWHLTPSGELRGLHGKCLDVRGPSVATATPLQIWTCLDVPQQKWRFY